MHVPAKEQSFNVQIHDLSKKTIRPPGPIEVGRSFRYPRWMVLHIRNHAKSLLHLHAALLRIKVDQ